MTSCTLTHRRRGRPAAALLLAAVALLAALVAAAAVPGPADAAARRGPTPRRPPATVYTYAVSVEGRATYTTESVIRGDDGDLRQSQEASFGWTARLGTARMTTRELLKPVSGPVALRNIATTQTQTGLTPEPIYCSGTSGEAGRSRLSEAFLLAPSPRLDLTLDPFASFRLPFTCSKLGDFGGQVFLVHPSDRTTDEGIYNVDLFIPADEMGMGQIIQRFDRRVDGCPAYAQQLTQRCSMDLHGQVELRLVARRTARRRAARRR